MNYIALAGRSSNVRENLAEFIDAAKQALKPGGRFIAVQEKPLISLLKPIAKSLGLSFHSIPVSEEVAKKSPSRALRQRATLKRRQKMFRDAVASDSKVMASVAAKMPRLGIKTTDELFKPVILIMRKPRTGERRIQTVTEIILEMNTDSATKNALRELLG